MPAHLLLLLVACVAGTRHAAQTDVVERAMSSAAARVARRDSICHGAHHHRNFTEQVYMSFVRRRATEQAAAEDHALLTKYHWCRSDAACCADYSLQNCTQAAQTEINGDFEKYRYLYKEHDPAYPLTQLLDESGICGGGGDDDGTLSARATADEDGGEQTLENMLKKAWILEMRLQRCSSGQVRCGENQKFIYSPTDSEGHCVCASSQDADCHAVYRRVHTSPWNYSIVAIVVSSVAIFIFAALEIYKIIVQVPLFRKLHNELRKSATSRADTVTLARQFVSTITHDE
jgi:hypothetical protein